MALWKIAGGIVHDPTNGIDGMVRDVWIDGSRIVPAPTDPAVRPGKVLDATNRIVMAGGIDLHSHLAGPKVTAARKLRPEDRPPAPPPHGRRGGSGGSVPSSFATGYLYAGLGFTTAFDAAVPALFARHAHAELADTPIIDKGFWRWRATTITPSNASPRATARVSTVSSRGSSARPRLTASRR